ncbi:MAG: hypothetical protein E7637_01815 [Ruminococcaceae bacterium]|nr:hypothetical protein [Oscillospiraceae bacterium]
MKNKILKIGLFLTCFMLLAVVFCVSTFADDASVQVAESLVYSDKVVVLDYGSNSNYYNNVVLKNTVFGFNYDHKELPTSEVPSGLASFTTTYGKTRCIDATNVVLHVWGDGTFLTMTVPDLYVYFEYDYVFGSEFSIHIQGRHKDGTHSFAFVFDGHVMGSGFVNLNSFIDEGPMLVYDIDGDLLGGGAFTPFSSVFDGDAIRIEGFSIDFTKKSSIQDISFNRCLNICGFQYGCPLSYDVGLEEGIDKGFDDGYSFGYNDGYLEGESDGLEAGYDMGYEEGIDKGFDDGYSFGYGDGYLEGESDGLEAGYDMGKLEAFDEFSACLDVVGSLYNPLEGKDIVSLDWKVIISNVFGSGKSVGIEYGYSEGYAAGYARGDLDARAALSDYYEEMRCEYGFDNELLPTGSSEMSIEQLGYYLFVCGNGYGFNFGVDAGVIDAREQIVEWVDYWSVNLFGYGEGAKRFEYNEIYQSYTMEEFTRQLFFEIDQQGYAFGTTYGFELGQTDAMQTTDSLKGVVFAIFDAPVQLVNGMLNFDLFGINVLALLQTLLTMAVVGVIIFVLIKFII